MSTFGRRITGLAIAIAIAAAVGLVLPASPALAAGPASLRPAARKATVVKPKKKATACKPTRTKKCGALPRATPAAPAPGAAPAPFTFLQTHAGGPVRWNPCQAHAYEMNRAAPSEASIAAVHAAFREIGAATGITFRFAGFVDHGYMGTNHPVNIYWAAPLEVPYLPAGATGAGMPVAVPTERGPVYSGGSVFFPRTTETTRNTALHEIGHIAGLGHVQSSSQVMATMHSAISDYSTGDRAGLQAVGAGRGCLPATPA